MVFVQLPTLQSKTSWPRRWLVRLGDDVLIKWAFQRARVRHGETGGEHFGHYLHPLMFFVLLPKNKKDRHTHTHHHHHHNHHTSNYLVMF